MGFFVWPGHLSGIRTLDTLGRGVGVKSASGALQGNLLFKTCFERRSFGPAKGESNPSPPAGGAHHEANICSPSEEKIKEYLPDR